MSRNLSKRAATAFVIFLVSAAALLVIFVARPPSSAQKSDQRATDIDPAKGVPDGGAFALPTTATGRALFLQERSALQSRRVIKGHLMRW